MARKDFLALLTRLFLGYLFLSSGLCKLTEGHFGQLMGPHLLIQWLTPYKLGGFAVFIAVSQIASGALVLSQRYSLLGLVMLVPMNLGMLAVTISQNWSGTPYVDTVFLAMNLGLLLYEWDTLRFFLFPEAISVDYPRVNRLFRNRWLPVGVLLSAVAATGTAFYEASLTLVPATLCFGFTYANVYTNRSLDGLDRLMLALSLLAILGVTYYEWLISVRIVPMFFFLAIVALILLLFLVSMYRSWIRTRREEAAGYVGVGD